MRYHIIIFAAFVFASFLFTAQTAYAADITISVNQTEYYFKTGETATIKFETDNTYKKDINGMLTYTTTQQTIQQGYQFSSSNTQSQTAKIKEKLGELILDFGTSDSPSTITASITYTYTEKDQREIVLDDIKIHFVADDSQKNNQENKKESSSQKTAQQPQQSKQNPQQKQQPSKTQQQKNAVQNNQMNQDAGALKQEMQRQREEYAQMQQQIADQLGKDPEVSKAHQEMIDQGYNMTSFEIEPETNNTGNFKMNYQRADGETGTVSGRLQNNTVEELSKESSAEQKQMQQQMMQDPRFQNLSKQLEQEGYNHTGFEKTSEGNVTQMTAQFQGPDGQTANITAQFQNSTITKVEMKKKETGKSRSWLVAAIAILMLAALTGYYLYRKYFSDKKADGNGDEKKEKPIDYKKESKRLLEEAKRLFAAGHEKDAYELAGRALRFYHTHNLNHRKELTNTKTINVLKENKQPYRDTQKCLNMCGMVEFAKYKANKKDFHEITEIVEGEIGKK